MKKLLSVLLLLMFGFGAFAQELNCKIQINSSKIQGTNKSVFNTLEKSMTDFMNNTRWTNLDFNKDERIDCAINIVINSADGEAYESEMTVQASRPVYNSSYTTPIFNFRDKTFNFTYQEFEQLNFNPNNINSNIVATLAYYAYVIIGIDLDSYSKLGGTVYFEKAEDIVNQMQSKNFAGWKAFESDVNKYAFIDNMLDEAFKKYREYFYNYHRLGLDVMAENVTNGRAKIADGIQVLREANRARPSAIVITTFLNSKTDELINIFKQGTREEKEKVIEILTDVNPANENRYQEINH